MKAIKIDNRMNDKELLLEAIDNYDVYSSMQAKILKTLINISVDDVAIIAPRTLSELIGTTRTTVYSCLSKLQKDGCIKILKDSGERLNTFKINKVKLNEIILNYQKKLQILKNN